MAKNTENERKVKEEIVEESEPKKEKKKKPAEKERKTSSANDERAPMAPKARRKRGSHQEASEEIAPKASRSRSKESKETRSKEKESAAKKTTTSKAKRQTIPRDSGSPSRESARSVSKRQSRTSKTATSPVIKRSAAGNIVPKRLKQSNSTTKRPVSPERGASSTASPRSGRKAAAGISKKPITSGGRRSHSADTSSRRRRRGKSAAQGKAGGKSSRSRGEGRNNNNRLLSPETRSRSGGRKSAAKKNQLKNLLSPERDTKLRVGEPSIDSGKRRSRSPETRRGRQRSSDDRSQPRRSPNDRERSTSQRKHAPRRSGSRSRGRSWRNRSRARSFSRKRRSRSRSPPRRFRSRSRSRRNNGKTQVTGVNAMPLGDGRPLYRDSRSKSRRTRSMSPDRIRLWVLNNDCARIIGKQGNAMKDIEEECNVRLVVQKEQEMRQLGVKERYVDIRGKKAEDREKAKERVMELADFVKDNDGFVLKGDVEDVLKLRVLSDEVGRILGRRGQMIKEIENNSGARIEVNKRRGVIEIHGNGDERERATDKILEEVSWCKTMDGKVLKDEPPQSDDECLKMYVLDKEAGRVIGRGGETVRVIMEQSKAEVKVQKNEGYDVVANERLIQIYGDKEYREKAKELILNEVTFAKDRLGGIIKNTGNHNVPAGIEIVRQKGVNKGAWICGFCSGDHKTKLCPSTQMNAQALAQMHLLAGMAPVLPIMPPGIPASMMPPALLPGVPILSTVPRPPMGAPLGAPRRPYHDDSGPSLFPPPPPPAPRYPDFVDERSSSPLMPPHIPASAPDATDNKSVASSSSGKSRRTVQNERNEEKNEDGDADQSEAIDEDDL